MTRTTAAGPAGAALPPRRPPGLGRLGGGHLGLRPRRLPPHVARRRRARGRRPLRHQHVAAVDLHHPAGLRLCGDAAARRGAARPLRLQAAARRRPHAADRRAARLRVRPLLRGRACCAACCSAWATPWSSSRCCASSALWFSPRRTPMVTQLTGVLGQLGALAAAGPLAAALAHLRVDAVVCRRGVLRGPQRRRARARRQGQPLRRPPPRRAAAAGASRRTLRAAWLVPGTRLGLWSHFTSQFAANMFTMLWGFPFLICGTGPLAGDGERHALAHGRRRRSSPARSSAR